MFQNIDQQQEHRRRLARSGLAQQHDPGLIGAEAVEELLAQLSDDSGGQHLDAGAQLPRRDGSPPLRPSAGPVDYRSPNHTGRGVQPIQLLATDTPRPALRPRGPFT